MSNQIQNPNVKMFSKMVNYLSFSQHTSPGIPTASPFCKGGLRGIFLIQPGLIENLLFSPLYISISVGCVWIDGWAYIF
ncbi:MAG: hypothetical protein B1H12_07405 [Desulfobacteraceae bacterium 4484_190.2]|nr:MAG: hypothetical protein B1H12_07405 [Desulfobacteraceae bacterium 4484_190.2]